MTDGHCFISYSTADALEFARKLADELQGGEDTFFKTWFDKRDIDPARDWDDQIVEGIRDCNCMAFVMTKDSTAPGSMCKNEWTWALKYKKVVIPIRLHKDAEQPFGLGNRQWIDFTGDFDHGLSKLRLFLREMDSPKGVLQSLRDRHADAERDLRRAKEEDKPRIQADIEQLKADIQVQEKIVANPEAAKKQTETNIQSGLERERQPEKPVVAKTSTKFINPPPGIAPTYFQDRYFETEQIAGFLKDASQRLMTIVGRAGVGKTATICRLLKDLERGVFPDNLGEMQVDGIVYLSEVGSHKINFANIFYDLCKLLPTEANQKLDTLYKNPQGSTESKIQALLDYFQDKPVILLLDNFEPLVEETENLPIRDAELDEALHAFLHGAHTAVKAIITTRVPPQVLNRIQPGRQRVHHLESGLEPKYAEEMLRQMDKDGILGFKNADTATFNKVYERTCGFPKALEALFQILASDRYTTLEELLAMPTPENVVEALVGEAFNRLDTNAQRVMQALAVYNRPVTPAAVDFVLSPHVPAIDSAPILQRLANMHFARKESGRFYLHPVDREFAFNLLAKGDEITVDNPELAQLYRQMGMQPPHKERNDFTKIGLTDRAADYFAQARKPRAEWKKLDDLAAQLAEFDLRCAAGDYDTAASVLNEISFEYLFLWGHYRLMIDLHEKLLGKIADSSLIRISIANLGSTYYRIGKTQDAIKYHSQVLELARENKDRQHEGAALGNLGNDYADLGNVVKAIEYYEQALPIAREIGDHRGEGVRLSNLGSRYTELGDIHKAIDYHEKALVIFHQIGDKNSESVALENLGHEFLSLNENQKAKENYHQSIQVADDISFPQTQNYARWGLAKTYLLQNDLVNARTTIEVALQYDVPENNHNASALHGIIALRQGDEVAARGAFVRAIGQADEILSKTAEYYSALDAKGLALCGLALCARDDGPSTVDDGRGAVPAPDGDGANTGRGDPGQGNPAPTVDDAIETFKKARKIAPHAGVVKSVLRLFDELVKCDEEGVLKGIREVIEGK